LTFQKKKATSKVTDGETSAEGASASKQVRNKAKSDEPKAPPTAKASTSKKAPATKKSKTAKKRSVEKGKGKQIQVVTEDEKEDEGEETEA